MKVEKASNNQVIVKVDVKNSSTIAGEEVVQLYVSQQKCSVDRPIKELKAFAKESIEAGETKTISMTLNLRAFQFWHPEKKQWTLEAGSFEILVGASSRDIKLKGLLTLE